MRFTANRWFLVKARKITTKKGSELTFLTFSDSTRDNGDFMASRDLDVSNIAVCQDYDVILDKDGDFISVVGLTPVQMQADKKAS